MEEMFSPIMCIHPCSLVDQDACAADQLLLSVTLGTTYSHQCSELVCEEEGGMEGRRMVEMEGRKGGVEGGGSEGRKGKREGGSKEEWRQRGREGGGWQKCGRAGGGRKGGRES